MQKNNRKDYKTEALRQLRSEICDDLIVDYIIDHLIDTKVVTVEEWLRILNFGKKVGNADDVEVRDQVLRTQTNCLLDLLMQKFKTNDFAYNNFIFSLNKDDNYPWIATKINKLIQELKENDERMEKFNLLLVPRCKCKQTKDCFHRSNSCEF